MSKRNMTKAGTTRTTIALRPETFQLLRLLKKATGAKNIGDAIELAITSDINKAIGECPRCKKIEKLFK